MLRRPQLWATSMLTHIGMRFGIDAHYFAKNSLIVTVSHGVSMLRGIITGYLVTRLMPPQMYGEYQFVLSVMGTIGVITLSGLPSSIAKSIAKEKDNAPLRFTIAWYGVLCSLGSIALLIAIGFLPLWGRESLAPLFVVAALLFVPSNIAMQTFGGIIKGTAKFGYALRINVLTGAVLSVAVLAMLFTKMSSLLLLTFMIGIPAVFYLFGLRNLLKNFPSTKKDWGILRYGFDLTVATVPVSLSWYLDKLLISALFGFNQLALFSVALLIPEQVKVWGKELMPIPFSKQARIKDTKSARAKITKITLIMMGIMVLGIAAYIAITPYIIPLLFPLYDTERVILLTNIAAATLVFMPATLFPQYLEAQGMIRALRWSHWSAAFTMTLALILLVPTYGLIGAIVARGIFRVTYVAYAAIALWITPPKHVD